MQVLFFCSLAIYQQVGCVELRHPAVGNIYLWPQPVPTNRKFASRGQQWLFSLPKLLMSELPYSDPLQPLADVTACVEHGYQNEQPEGCPAAVYAIMKTCWSLDAAKRPSFASLREQLAALSYA